MPLNVPAKEAIVVMAALLLGALNAPVLAMAPEPAPKVDCRKKANKDKAECKQKSDAGGGGAVASSDQLSDDEIYYASYWLAKSGRYAEALAELRKAENQDDPRILNYIGFTTRKLGRVDEALGYYQKALAKNPDYTMARAYLGEAYLQKGDVARAQNELAEIEKRCGKLCPEYAELAGHLREHAGQGAGLVGPKGPPAGRS